MLFWEMMQNIAIWKPVQHPSVPADVSVYISGMYTQHLGLTAGNKVSVYPFFFLPPSFPKGD